MTVTTNSLSSRMTQSSWCQKTQDVSAAAEFTNVQSINQSCIIRVVQVTKSLQDPLEVGNNLLEISDNVTK